MSEKVWTKEKIQEGFEKFFQQNGRYPTANEIDAFPGLPSSRQIQRAFGGLVNLRKNFGLEITNFGNGKNRSDIAKTINQRGGSLEKNLEKILIDYFGEYFVHIEKPLSNYYKPGSLNQLRTKSRADFFIYAQSYQFCIDIFYADSYRNLVNIINTKQKNYSDLNIDVYMVNGNENKGSGITMEKINRLYVNKTNKLEANIYMMNIECFIQKMKTMNPIRLSI